MLKTVIRGTKPQEELIDFHYTKVAEFIDSVDEETVFLYNNLYVNKFQYIGREELVKKLEDVGQSFRNNEPIPLCMRCIRIGEMLLIERPRERIDESTQGELVEEVPF